MHGRCLSESLGGGVALTRLSDGFQLLPPGGDKPCHVTMQPQVHHADACSVFLQDCRNLLHDSRHTCRIRASNH